MNQLNLRNFIDITGTYYINRFLKLTSHASICKTSKSNKFGNRYENRLTMTTFCYFTVTVRADPDPHGSA